MGPTVARMAKTQLMISSRGTREGLGPLEDACVGLPHQQEAPTESHCELKPLLKRIALAKGPFDWPKEKWGDILWTDESKIVLFGSKTCCQMAPPH